MTPPFTAAEFFEVFVRYNLAVWPAQLVLTAAGISIAAAAYRANTLRSPRWAHVALILLAALWLWSGIAYHKTFFTMLSPAGEIFGSLFIAEAALLLLRVWQNGTAIERPSTTSVFTGNALIAYALFGYPLLAYLLGHEFPAMPTFGAPCPTTIFTFGVFCLLPTSISRFDLAIPVVWTFIGSWGAISYGVPEDAGMIVAAVAAFAVLHHETHHPHHPAPNAIAT